MEKEKLIKVMIIIIMKKILQKINEINFNNLLVIVKIPLAVIFNM